MMNTWALPSPIQTRGQSICSRFRITGLLACCSCARLPRVRAPHSQTVKIQSGSSGEALL
jgi:hypothetical protein